MTRTARPSIAVYTGVFDPVHLGHIDVIRRGSGITARDRVGDAGHRDRAGETAIAELLVFAVPASVRRYPDLEMDVRIAARLDGARHPAQTGGSDRAAGHGLAGSIGLREGDGRVRQRQAAEAGAGWRCSDRAGLERDRRQQKGVENASRLAATVDSGIHGICSPWNGLGLRGFATRHPLGCETASPVGSD